MKTFVKKEKKKKTFLSQSVCLRSGVPGRILFAIASFCITNNDILFRRLQNGMLIAV